MDSAVHGRKVNFDPPSGPCFAAAQLGIAQLLEMYLGHHFLRLRQKTSPGVVPALLEFTVPATILALDDLGTPSSFERHIGHPGCGLLYTAADGLELWATLKDHTDKGLSQLGLLEPSSGAKETGIVPMVGPGSTELDGVSYFAPTVTTTFPYV